MEPYSGRRPRYRRFTALGLVLLVSLAVGSIVARAPKLTAKWRLESELSHLARCGAWGDIPRIQVLLTKGYGLNQPARGFFGWTPLIAAIRHDNIPMVRWLLTHGADPAARCLSGETPLMHTLRAQGTNSVQLVELLVAAGADPFATNFHGINFVDGLRVGVRSTAELIGLSNLLSSLPPR